ncbi:exonuclease domain-containing protein [Geodermatophilus sp. SYSU D00779]
MTALLPTPRTPLEGGAAVGLDFVAFDVETANAARGSVCAIGAAVVRGGTVVATHSWRTRPPAGLDEFDWFNVDLHGITAEMVAEEPPFAERLDQLLEVADGLPLVAHNAAFDMGALREACIAAGREWPAVDYACSLVMARRALDLISYRLPMVADECGVDLADHHEAGADAAACARIVLEIARRRGAADFASLCRDLQVLPGRLEAAAWSGCHSSSPSGAVPAAAADADPTHPLFGQVVVFTGALSIHRQDAWDAVAGCGAVVEKGVTKRTTMLVVGDGFTGRDPAEFWSGKAEKAVRWRQKGHRIEVLTEADLVDLLTETRTSGTRAVVVH